MSLIIEGMKMPEYRDVFGDERGCVYLLMLTVNKDGTASMQFNDVDGGFYRVKEIRTPHGRLIDEAPTIIEAEVNNEQRTKYAICRPYDGITLNTEVEFLLDHNGDVMLFDSDSAAWEYLKPFGITEEELNAIKVVEYKEASE